MLFIAITFDFIGLCYNTEIKNIGRTLFVLGIQCKSIIGQWYSYKSIQNMLRICECMMEKLVQKRKEPKKITIDLLCIVDHCLITCSYSVFVKSDDNTADRLIFLMIGFIV